MIQSMHHPCLGASLYTNQDVSMQDLSGMVSPQLPPIDDSIQDVILRTPENVFVGEQVVFTEVDPPRQSNLAELMERSRHLEDERRKMQEKEASLIQELERLKNDMDKNRQETMSIEEKGKQVVKKELDLVNQQGTIMSTLHQCKRMCEFILALEKCLPTILNQCVFLRCPLLDHIKKTSDLRSLTKECGEWQKKEPQPYLDLKVVSEDYEQLKRLSLF